MNYIDITVLLIFVLSIVLGLKKGFLKTVTGLAAMVLSLALATAFYPYVAEIVMKTPVYDIVYENTAAVIAVPEQASDCLTTDYGTGKLGLPRDFLNDLEKNIDTVKDTAVNVVADAIAAAAVKIISVLCVFLLVRLLLSVVIKLAGILRRLPVIGWGDSLLGALFGLFRGLLIIYVLMTFMTFAASVSSDGVISNSIKHSSFARVMYNDNFILDFVFKQE